MRRARVSGVWANTYFVMVFRLSNYFYVMYSLILFLIHIVIQVGALLNTVSLDAPLFSVGVVFVNDVVNLHCLMT